MRHVKNRNSAGLRGKSCQPPLFFDFLGHGFTWVVDEIHTNKLTTPAALHVPLLLLAGDPAARLPRQELTASIKRYGDLR